MQWLNPSNDYCVFREWEVKVWLFISSEPLKDVKSRQQDKNNKLVIKCLYKIKFYIVIQLDMDKNESCSRLEK